MLTYNSRVRIELSRQALAQNYHYFNSINKVCAILKGNAMGHGSVLLARELEAMGCDNFGVATLEEAIELRENHIHGEILLLSNPQEYPN